MVGITQRSIGGDAVHSGQGEVELAPVVGRAPGPDAAAVAEDDGTWMATTAANAAVK